MNIFSHKAFGSQKWIAGLCGHLLPGYWMKSCTRLVLVAYTLLLFKPVMPVIVDNWEHQFNARQHFLLVHRHNGAYHVHAELNKISREEQDGKSSRHQILTEMDVHLVVDPILIPAKIVFRCSVKHSPDFDRFHDSPDSRLEAPPPRLV